MMTEGNNRTPEELDEDLVKRLAFLGELIDRQAYPGVAWPVRRRVPVVLRLATAAAAAAAVVLLGLILLAGPQPARHAEPTLPQVATAVEQPKAPLTWAAPSEFDVSYVADMKFSIPSVSFRSAGDAGRCEWVVPTVSFLSPEWSEDNGS